MLTVLVCDLNGFKQINDQFGHLEGNRVLRDVAEALRCNCREYDYVARMGGDEFTLLLPGLSAPEDGAKVAQKLLASLAEPISLNGHELFVTTSLGTGGVVLYGPEYAQKRPLSARGAYWCHHLSLRLDQNRGATELAQGEGCKILDRQAFKPNHPGER